jgi:hypothetical protein
MSEGIDREEDWVEESGCMASEVVQGQPGQWNCGMGDREEDPWSAEVSELGRSHCRAPDAGIVYLIDRNGKRWGYSVSMELSEITVE